MDNAIAGFCAVTGANAEIARKYLEISEGNVEQAISLFFDNANIFSDHETANMDDIPNFEQETPEEEDSNETEESGRTNRIYESQGTIILLK